MLEIHAIFPEKNDAEKANDRMCELFKGMNAFINNDIIVTPIAGEHVGGRKVWAFDICVADSGVDHSVSIMGGELLLTNASNNVWAFSEMVVTNDAQ